MISVLIFLDFCDDHLLSHHCLLIHSRHCLTNQITERWGTAMYKVMLMTMPTMALIPAIAQSKVQGPTEGGLGDAQWLIAARYSVLVQRIHELQALQRLKNII